MMIINTLNSDNVSLIELIFVNIVFVTACQICILFVDMTQVMSTPQKKNVFGESKYG